MLADWKADLKIPYCAQNNLDYDQLIILELNQLNISPEREKTRVYDETFEEEKKRY
ncbi:MAG: hypothetical protein IPJ43_13795 [Saprospiraceae bacterium]|nr:hypothetical protein [Saprospiraceae bacterium]